MIFDKAAAQKSILKSYIWAGHRLLTPVILASQEAEIKRIKVWSQPREVSSRDPISKKTHYKKRAGGVAQSEGPEFKSQYWKKKAVYAYDHKIYFYA
jgi:hypothetical protein